MDEDLSEEGLPEPDSLGRFTIDERFNFSMPDVEPADARPAHAAGDTTPTPLGQEPDATKLEIGLDRDADADPLIGRNIGNYEIVSQLGRGGFGTVYKARDTKLQRFAALKFLRFPLDTEYRKLFSREAQVIANLGKHPAIVQIYSWGEYQGSYYFALEFLDASAEGLLESSGEPLPVKRALEIVSQCAGALHFAHEQGVLHRDVKPANILIDRKSGDAKLCDFGLAKFHTLGAGTVTSRIAGSPPYMAPEQIAGQTMDGRTDVYSLGVTLYELLSRKLPCTGSSHVDILEQIRNRKSTPLRQFRPDLSEAILDIVQRATSYRPEDRYQTAEEMEQAIKEVLKSLERTGTSGHAAAPTRRHAATRNRSRNWALGGAIAACGVAAALYLAIATIGRDEYGDVWPIAIADAKDQIDAGQYEQAITWLVDYVADHPDENFAHYALGYAYVLTSRLDKADDAFERVSDPPLKIEGLAALEHARNGPDSREVLESAVDRVPTGYPELLLASLDLSRSDFASAADRLKQIDRAAFLWDWQRRQYSQVLGRTEYNAGNFAAANQAFASANAGTDVDSSVGQMFERMATRQLDAERQETMRSQIARVRELADRIGADEVDEGEEWTSQPLRVRISPSDPGRSRLAIESGLADAFPEFLAEGLTTNDVLPIDIVNREFIGDVLYEQQLAELSKQVDRVRLGRLLGARMMIESKFHTLMGQDSVQIKIINTSTSRSSLVGSQDFDRSLEARTWIAELAELTTAKIRESYPIRGRLSIESAVPTINVGLNVGVREGMAFSVLTGPAAEHRLNASVQVVVEVVRDAAARVQLAGFSPDAIPAEGWFVEELPAP